MTSEIMRLLLWPEPINQGQKAGNTIIQFLFDRGIRLARCKEETDTYQSKMWFHAADEEVKLNELNQYSEELSKEGN